MVTNVSPISAGIFAFGEQFDAQTIITTIWMVTVWKNCIMMRPVHATKLCAPPIGFRAGQSREIALEHYVTYYELSTGPIEKLRRAWRWWLTIVCILVRDI